MTEIQVYIKEGVFTCEPNISIETWREILNDPQLSTPDILDVLSLWYNETGHKSTYMSLSDKYKQGRDYYKAIIFQFMEAICMKYDLRIIHLNTSNKCPEIIGMNGFELENGELEWELRPELIEALEELPELGLYVTSESQVIKNLITIEEYINSSDFHDFAVDRIRLGNTFLLYNVGNEIHFAPSRFIGYVNSSKDKFELCKVKDGKETNRNFIKTFGWTTTEDSNLDMLLESYCQKFGVLPKNGGKTYFQTNLSLSERYMDDYKRFKKLLEYFIAHYKYVKSEDINIKGYKEYILPHIIKGDFVATGFGWKYQQILTMITGLNCYRHLPGTEILLTCKKNQFGNMGPKTCYMQIAETTPAINIMLVGKGLYVDELKLSLYNYHTDKTWDDIDFYKINDLGLYDNNAGITAKLKDMFDKFVKLYKDQIMNDKNQQAKEKIRSLHDLLEYKKNIILQGAPGTGKTYTTASLAVLMCNKKFVDYADHGKVMEEYERLRQEGQISFCTFHQSMDYEDFIEGLKPEINENNTIEYKVEDGIFKDIVDKAMHNLIDSQKPESEQINDIQTRTLFEKYCTFLESQLVKTDSVELYPQSKMRIRNITRIKSGSAYSIQLAKDDNSPTQGLTIDVVERDYQKFKNGEIKSYEDVKPSYSSKSMYHGNAIYYFELYKKLENFEKTISLQTINEKIFPKNYVLIIDEINRGNVSRIFGELITLLECDKRTGGNHKICTILPYSKKEFSVPMNLYIIGTMNTTDRSTGTIDYAVRRRFAFVTLESNIDTIAEWYDNRENSTEETIISTKNAAIALFNEINGISKDDVNSFIYQHKAADFEFEDLMIGHSYFMAKDIDTLKLKMQYEVIPLIKEYIKDGILKSNSNDEQYFRHWMNAECNDAN